MSDRYVLAPRHLVELVLRDTADPSVRLELEGVLDHTSAPEVVAPPWEKVRNMAAQLGDLLAERGPVAVHELDQLRANMRDELDKLDLSLHDEWVVYHGLVWVAMVVELARNGYKNEGIGSDVLEAIEQIATTIASGLLDFVPPQARR